MSASGIDESTPVPDVCANCGKEGGGDAKLKECAACHLVRYCDAHCQKAHLPDHRTACKKRAAELHDERLFARGHDFFLADCPLCCVPFPVHAEQRAYTSCCMKTICLGCEVAMGDNTDFCPFCRTKQSFEMVDDEMRLAMIRLRMDAGDAEAYDKLGSAYRLGNLGKAKDSAKAVELWTEGARLGSVNARCSLGCAHDPDTGSYDVKKDDKLSRHHYEIAAMGGHHIARNNLGVIELRKGRHDLALKHFMIAAKIGFELSLTNIKDMYADGNAKRDDYTEALTVYQSAIKKRSTQERETAKREKEELRRRKKAYYSFLL